MKYRRFPTASCPTATTTIHIAGHYETALRACQQYCDDVGLCVTVTKTTYIFTGGSEEGVTVGLINYPRFPKSAAEVYNLAYALALQLRDDLEQESFTIETIEYTRWFSWRTEDYIRLDQGESL